MAIGLTTILIIYISMYFLMTPYARKLRRLERRIDNIGKQPNDAEGPFINFRVYDYTTVFSNPPEQPHEFHHATVTGSWPLPDPRARSRTSPRLLPSYRSREQALLS